MDRVVAWSRLFLLLVVLSCVKTPAAAQAVRGVVVDDQNLSRVSVATVRLVINDVRRGGTETDAQGRFFLPVPGAGNYRLEVSRVGYQTTRSQAFRVEGDDTVSVEFRVAPNALLLDPITVTAHSTRGRDVFERHRKEWGQGIFLTPEQIDSINPRHPADVFRNMDKVVMRWNWGTLASGGPGAVPSVRTQLGRGCLLYMVDRLPVRPPPWAPGPWSSYQLGNLQGDEVVAVEVYRSVLEVPKELRRYTNEMYVHWNPSRMGVTLVDNVNCGLAVFWTGAGW